MWLEALPIFFSFTTPIGLAASWCAGVSVPDPQSSSLTFESVCLTYPGRRVPALDYVSFTVQAGWHFGICGRTGAGKSSILTALFQLAPLHHGSIRIGTLDMAGLSAGCVAAAHVHPCNRSPLGSTAGPVYSPSMQAPFFSHMHAHDLL